VQKNRLNI